MVKVDVTLFSMSDAGTEVVKTHVSNNSLVFDWQNKEWATWEQLIHADAFQTFLSECNKRLQQAAESKQKGAGKVKSHTS